MNIFLTFLSAACIASHISVGLANETARNSVTCTDAGLRVFPISCSAKYKASFPPKIKPRSEERIQNEWLFAVEALLMARGLNDIPVVVKREIAESMPKLSASKNYSNNAVVHELNKIIKKNMEILAFSKPLKFVAYSRNELDGVWWDQSFQIVPFMVLLDDRFLVVKEISWTTVQGTYSPFFGASLAIEPSYSDSTMNFVGIDRWNSVAQYIFLRSSD